ncbi:MAG: GH92 family glycosyl hydrolase [Paraglaciecola sp.]|uniref:GH92 family glycosyl hydrolase n=1 Tax=Paraglaciecola sp. TaxID=1920173 RepID=UPI00329899EA
MQIFSKRIPIFCMLLAGLSVQAKQPTDYVNPFIGTSNFGATHPGAQYPHALTSVSPFNVAHRPDLNKFEKDAAWNSRVYVDDNAFLTGFSHVNLSGVGCPDLGVVLLMPTTGELELDPQKYGSSYKNQQATPGYYSNELQKYAIKTEATSTQRTGLSRYTFPAGQANIILNLGLGLSNETGGALRIVSDREIEGSRTIGTFCYNPEDVRPVYFVAQFSHAAKRFGGFKKMPKYTGVEGEWIGHNDTIKPYPNYRQILAGDEIGAYFSFDTQADETLQVKVGISYVSIDNARENLKAEQPNFDFEKTKMAAEHAWNSLLKRIQLKGTDQNKTLFYSALYHSLIHPSIIQDVNGDYPLMQANRKTSGPLFGNIKNSGEKNRYSVYSLWDSNRNVHPLLSLIYPEIQSEMMATMVAMYNESGWLPKWELLGMETQVMVGDPATVVLADTYLRGIQDFDINTAYAAMKKSADATSNNPLRPENQDYLHLGYVPVDDEGPYDGSVSTSLEYYLADFNLGVLAQTLGKTKDAETYLARAQGYRKLFDPQTGMLRPKKHDGSWYTPYDPQLGRNFEPAPGYIEGNAWNYRFYVPHDIPGLIALLGGEDNFIEQLAATFTTNNYDMANEPDITYPYLFNYVPEQAAKSREKVSALIKQHYHNTAGGIPGNDDAGTLSSWLIFSMMGFYPTAPGIMEYALVAPAFDEIKIHLSDKYYAGKPLIIRPVEGEQSHFNGNNLDKAFISHKLLTQGGELRLAN